MIPFHKLSGGGNDFIALVEPALDPSAEEISAWCRRGISVGADGLVVLRRAGNGLKLAYYNSDGLAADLCLNATRCAARLAHELGLAGERSRIQTGAGVLDTQILDHRWVAVDAPLPSAPPKHIKLDGEARPGWHVIVGVPHYVRFESTSLRELDVAGQGARLRSSPGLGSRGANVDFVHVASRSSADVRSFERGIEGETLACGTGILATAAAGVAEGCLDLPLDVRTRGGFLFEVRGSTTGTAIDSWSLAGDARIVVEGCLRDGAGPHPDC